MKTKEQIKSEVVNYLKKCSGHLFKIEGGYKWSGPARYVQEEEKELKVIINGDQAFFITGDDVVKIDIDKIIEAQGTNSKSIIKGRIFWRYDYKLERVRKVWSIPNYKSSKRKWSDITESIENSKSSEDVIKLIQSNLK
jgi:hypothetical protein